MKDFFKINIDYAGILNYDIHVYDRQSRETVMLSAIGSDTVVHKSLQELKKNKASCYDSSLCHRFNMTGNYEIFKERSNEFSSTHMVISKKDFVGDENSKENPNTMIFYLYVRNGEDILNSLYEKLYDLTSIPILKEWMPYLYKNFSGSNKNIKKLDVNSIYTVPPFTAYKVVIPNEKLENLISYGLKNKILKINNSNKKSKTSDYIEGLDSYLNLFGDTLASKIQESFVPKFNPETQERDTWVNHYDDSCYYKGINMYDAQKNTIQASVNNLNENDFTLVVGEMGCGKTLIGAGIPYAHYKKKSGMTNIVMSPGHLVDKWKREIEKLVPNGKAYIIKDIKDLLSLKNKICTPIKKEHTYLILSMGTAKSSYEERPCAVWSKTKDAFICPDCGSVLLKKEKDPVSKKNRYVKLDVTDFSSKKNINLVCSNNTCNAKLWTTFNKNEPNLKWIKCGTSGWFLKEHIHEICCYLDNEKILSKEQNKLLKNLKPIKIALDNNESIKGIKGPRKYSLAKYIKNYFKGHIDYLILDELHLLKGGKTDIGMTMTDLIVASKKTIGLTGTLLNGYASGLFYILYRCMPNKMKNDGFLYESEVMFSKRYGVSEKKTTIKTGKKSISSSKEKFLPGVSPLVFTKFLLDSTVFVSLSDMDGGLPGYEEIPVMIDMDEHLAKAYEVLDQDFRKLFSFNGEKNGKFLSNMLQTLSIYPDMPYNQHPIVDEETGEKLVTPINLDTGLRNKELKLLELVKEKIENGEKVLVYYEFSNKTDAATKLQKMFKDNNIKAKILTSSISPEDREEWIEKELKNDIQVLLCNPKLVETGLDLLAFTNIVFYQIGYNIFTLRQASRRSWRLSQTKDIKVYFLCYYNTIQAQALSLMATKLQASMAIEGKFSEEGLRAMSDNQDMLTKIAGSVIQGIEAVSKIDMVSVEKTERVIKNDRVRTPLKALLIEDVKKYTLSYLLNNKINNKNKNKAVNNLYFSNKLHIGNLF